MRFRPADARAGRKCAARMLRIAEMTMDERDNGIGWFRWMVIFVVSFRIIYLIYLLAS